MRSSSGHSTWLAHHRLQQRLRFALALSIPSPQADPAFTKELQLPVMKSVFVISVP